VAFTQSVEDVNDYNNCYGDEETETPQKPAQLRRTMKRRDNESHQRRERVLRDCMSDTENASEKRKQLGWILSEHIKSRISQHCYYCTNAHNHVYSRSGTNTNYDK